MALRVARDSLGQRVDAAHYADEHTIITRNGDPRAVIVSYETYQTLIANGRGSLGQNQGQTSPYEDSPRLQERSTETVPDQAKDANGRHHTPEDSKN